MQGDPMKDNIVLQNNRKRWLWRRTSLMLVLALALMGSACPVDEEEDDAGSSVPALPDMKFILVPAGSFDMGSPLGELGRAEDEILHEVEISSFWMLESEVTQSQWKEIMGNSPAGNSSCDDCPVENVSWNQVVDQFIPVLSAEKSGTYRLPTEAEWEYAARSRSNSAFANGGIIGQTCNEGEDNLDQIGWHCFNSGNTTHIVKGKDDNAFLLYDMHGNVAEWVQDWYGSYGVGDVLIDPEPEVDPQGPESGQNKVVRGGSFNSLPPECRSASRQYFLPGTQANNIGFRLVWEP